jgi:hypothetical protein
MPTLAEVVENQFWLPLALDYKGGAMRFGRISREALAREPFLDARMKGATEATAEFRSGDIFDALARTPPPPAPALIHHTSFCCSTLLARALDAPGVVLSLKEPNILMDVANAIRVEEHLKRDSKKAAGIVEGVLRLLARPAPGEKKVVIKLTNAASSLVHLTNAKSLLVYGGLKDYLVSILKKSEEGRSFVRTQYNIFSLDSGGLSRIPQRQAMTFTDLQVAALVWRSQIENFAVALARPSPHMASLDYRRLLEDPAKTLKAAAQHLDLPIPDAMLDKAATSDIFERDSKFSDREYDAQRREADEAALVSRWNPEIELILNWAGPINLGADARLPLARSLV